MFDRTLAEQKAETLRWIEEGRLGLPTLVFWGRDDPSALLEQGYKLFDLISAHDSRARLYVINHAGHFCYREYPDEFNRVVTQFIQAQS